MRCKFNPITFGDITKTYNQDKHKIVETFDDNKILMRRVEYDQFGRDIDAKRYNKAGRVIDHMSKEYFENENSKGFIETVKGDFVEYVRKSYTKIINGYVHKIEEYKSSTKPQNNYINEFIYTLNGKFVKVISSSKK